MVPSSNDALDWSAVKLLDCTLRDGSYAVDFQFDVTFVVDLLKRLNETHLDLIEVGHGVGLEAHRVGISPGNIDENLWCDLANTYLPNKPWGMFAQPNFTQVETIANMADRGMSFVRIGMEPHKVPANLDYLHAALSVCDRVYLNLMKSSSVSPRELQSFVKGAPQELAGVYVVDSYGALLPDDVAAYVQSLREDWETVGFHGHDTLGMANINTMAAIHAGATIADACLNGIGRGSGNASTESLAGVIALVQEDLYDYMDLADLAEKCRCNMNVTPENRNLHVLGGVIGVHSGFFPLIDDLATRKGLSHAVLMREAVDSAQITPEAHDFHRVATVLSGK